MKRATITRSIPLFATLTLLACFAGASLADPMDPIKPADKNAKGIQSNVGKVQLDQAHVHVHKRPPVAHKPLEMVDLKTGQKVTADKMLDLPNGKKMKAGEYYAELNKLEKKFNDIGYTLSDRTGGKVVLQQTKINEKELDDHSQKLNKTHLAFDAKAMRAVPSHADILKKQADGQKNDATRVASLGKVGDNTQQAKTSQAVKPWNYTIGNKKIVAAYLSGKLEIKGSKDDVTVLGEARAGGFVINHDVNLIKANGSVHAPAKGQSKASLHVYLLGQHVINVDKSADLSWQVSDTKQHGIDVHAEFHFAIGPIPMVAHIGARGNVGFRYMMAVRPAHATFQVTPFVDAKVYVKVGVDIFMVSAGAGGEVTLIKDELNIGAELDLKFDSTRGPSLTEHFYAKNDMTILSGKIFVWAKVNYLFGSKEWHYDLWSFKGIQAHGYLFNETRTTYLIPNYQAVAQK